MTPLLTKRNLNLLWISYFAMHLVAGVIIDFQYFYPKEMVPDFLVTLRNLYLKSSGDPFMKGVFQRVDHSYAWFEGFLMHEMFFQVPCFILGIIALSRAERWIYPLLLAYGASAATTTWACLIHLFKSPDGVRLSSAEKSMLLSSYVPFFLLPLGLAIDMSMRLSGLLQQVEVRGQIKKNL